MFAERFNTQYRNPERFNARPGSRIKKTYGGVYDELGRLMLEEKGDVNLYEEIQSYKDSVDINVILKRYASGDVDVLSRIQGSYGDFTGMPKSYSEMLNIVNNSRETFDQLPIEAKEVFNYDFNEFMNSVIDGSLMKKLGYKDTPLTPAEEGAKSGAGVPSPDEK